MMRLVLAAAIIVVALCGGASKLWAPSDDLMRCNGLADLDFGEIPDAPTQVIEAKTVHPKGDVPGYCQVSGYVAPSTGFLLRLPLSGWNEKFMELGCGGLCGATSHIDLCDNPLRRGYACIVTDGGHRSTGDDAKWAYHNLQAIADYLIVSSHVTALVGKAIVESYYSQAPKTSYFVGCSAGGEQAITEAQRFPWDFDGIIAGQPGETVFDLSYVWNLRAYSDEAGRPRLAAADLDILHHAVVEKCDVNDGIKDGLIGDPRRCAFDPATLLCVRGKTVGCLTAEQVDTVKKLYSGPVTSKGEQIALPGLLRGSELTWSSWFTGPEGHPLAILRYTAEPFRYFTLQPTIGPPWSLKDFDFDRDYKHVGLAESLFSPTHPDLRRFKAAGGKLLAYGGWNDAAGQPMWSVDYYETVEKLIGGRAPTQDFFRLFMIPGMNHCYGGDGAFAIDYLTYLENWVEHGIAPDKMIGAHIDSPSDPAQLREHVRNLRFPLDPTQITFSRPVYPYPVTAKYLGRGNPKDAASFGPAQP